MSTENLTGQAIVALVLLAYAVCFGRIASRLGRNPWLFAALSVVPALNLLALAWLAFRPPPERA